MNFNFNGRLSRLEKSYFGRRGDPGALDGFRDPVLEIGRLFDWLGVSGPPMCDTEERLRRTAMLAAPDGVLRGAALAAGFSPEAIARVAGSAARCKESRRLRQLEAVKVAEEWLRVALAAARAAGWDETDFERRLRQDAADARERAGLADGQTFGDVAREYAALAA